MHDGKALAPTLLTTLPDGIAFSCVVITQKNKVLSISIYFSWLVMAAHVMHPFCGMAKTTTSKLGSLLDFSPWHEDVMRVADADTHVRGELATGL